MCNKCYEQYTVDHTGIRYKQAIFVHELSSNKLQSHAIMESNILQMMYIGPFVPKFRWRSSIYKTLHASCTNSHAL